MSLPHSGQQVVIIGQQQQQSGAPAGKYQSCSVENLL